MIQENGLSFGKVDQVPVNAGIERMSVDNAGWEILVSRQERVVGREIIDQGLHVINNWVDKFPRRNTWIQRAHGIPSPIVKIDATIHDGQLRVYEIEDRPAGMGYSGLVNPALRDEFAKVVDTWGPFKVVISPERSGTDDHLWAPQIDDSIQHPWRGRVLVRAEPSETRFHHLEWHSISTLKEEGDKSYGEEMGLWKKVNDSLEEGVFADAFVLKNLQGSKGKGIYIYVPKDLAETYGIEKKDFGKLGIVTRGKIEQTLSAMPEGMYLQPFFPPMITDIPDARFMIYRLFYGYDMKQSEWRFVGGTWNARDNLKIHGASDTINGSLSVENRLASHGEIFSFESISKTPGK